MTLPEPQEEGPSSPPTSSPSSSSSSEDDSDDEEYREEGSSNGKCRGSRLEITEIPKSDSSGKTKGKTKTTAGHSCPHCPKVFPFPNKLRQHMLIHEESRYTCRECDNQKFATFFELRTHNKQHHPIGHKCELCSYTNEKPAFVKRHFQQNHIDGVPCTVPGCTLKVARNRLKTHIRECHSDSAESSLPPAPTRAQLLLETCPKCPYTPDRFIEDPERRHGDVMRHIETIHDNKGVIACLLGCGTNVKLANLRSHVKKFHPDVPSSEGSSLAPDTNTMTSLASVSQSLSQEDQEDRDDEDLSDPELDEEPPKKKPRGIGSFECNKCSAAFKTLYNLQKHVKGVHEKSYAPREKTQKEFRCLRNDKKNPDIYCEKSFRTEQALNDHYNFHDDLQPYRCVPCNQRFYARDRLAVHLMKYHQTSIKDFNANEAMFGSFRKTESVEEKKPETSGASGSLERTTSGRSEDTRKDPEAAKKISRPRSTESEAQDQEEDLTLTSTDPETS